MMKNKPLLTGSHLRIYNSIFQHPAAHNLKWQDVHALFRHLGQVNEEPNGNFKVTISGKNLILRPPASKDVSNIDDLMSLRHFIQLSELDTEENEGKENHWLLVIDHREARIFKSEMPGASAQQVLPADPEEYFRQAHNSENFTRGKEKPDPNSYFEPVAAALQGAGAILIFGTGTGTGNEMDQFIAWVEIHHPVLAARIVGSLVVDIHHLTESQLLAKAREFHEGAKLTPV